MITALRGELDDLLRLSPDDTFYYLSIARHLATAGSPTFDGITVTTGFHPLYAAALVWLFKLFDPAPETFVYLSVWMNVCRYLGTLWVAWRIGNELNAPTGGLVMLAVFATSNRLGMFALSGMEASLNALVISIFLLVVV